MSFFDLAPTATQNLMDQARLNPINPEDMKPGWFAGTWKAPVTGLASAVNDAALLLGDAATPTLRTVARPVDTLFGTKTEDWLIGQQQIAKDNITAWAPDPRTTGIVGQAVHGIFNIVPEAMAGGPEVAAMLQGYKGMQAGIQDGLDPGTAFGKGAIDGISTWVGLKIPMTLAPTLGPAANVGAGAAANVATGMTSRGVTAEFLRSRGFNEMADQYQVLDNSAIAMDLIMGGAFGALAHYGPGAVSKYKDWQKKNDGKLLSSDEQTAMFLNSVLHAELDTAPGIPTTPAARAAHVEAMNKAISDLLADRPVEAPEGVTQADFIENPSATQTRTAILGAVEEHLGPEWQQLKGELEARGLPGDTTLYQVTPIEQRAPVRPTAEIKGIIDKATREGWDGERILSTLEGLANRLDDRNTANLEARKGDRVRGELWMREKLTRAERLGELPSESVRLAKWLIDQNPNVVADLAIAIRGKGEAGVAGGYNPLGRLITLFKGNANDETAVHEILHHTERMMPEEVRAGVRKEWLKELRAVENFAKTTQNQQLMQAVSDALKAAMGDEAAMTRLTDMVKEGQVDYNFYALANPSEFWAVNASRIIRGRAADGWVAKAKQWMTELLELVKGALSIRSDAAVIKGLNAVINADGTLSGDMLGENVSIYGNVLKTKKRAAESPELTQAKENLAKLQEQRGRLGKQSGLNKKSRTQAQDLDNQIMDIERAINEIKARDEQALTNPEQAKSDPYSIEALVEQNPEIKIPTYDGAVLPASEALAQTDAEIAKAEQDSQGFDAAVACALRG